MDSPALGVPHSGARYTLKESFWYDMDTNAGLGGWGKGGGVHKVD